MDFKDNYTHYSVYWKSSYKEGRSYVDYLARITETIYIQQRKIATVTYEVCGDEAFEFIKEGIEVYIKSPYFVHNETLFDPDVIKTCFGNLDLEFSFDLIDDVIGNVKLGTPEDSKRIWNKNDPIELRNMVNQFLTLALKNYKDVESKVQPEENGGKENEGTKKKAGTQK